jgi:hypothetical protein
MDSENAAKIAAELAANMPEKTPEQIAKEERLKMHAEGIEGGLGLTPEEEAVGKFMMLLPYVKRVGKNVSKKGMLRVLHALGAFPLGESTDVAKMGFRSNDEKQLFKLMYELNAPKSIILAAVRKEQQEIKAIQTTQETGEETNGN